MKPEKTPIPCPRESEERITAFMNLLPAPTPTRFIGKMHKLKADSDKKKSEGNLSKASSRRSSISPSTETIQEARETDSAINTPRAGPSGGFTTALRAVGKVKMGDLARKLKKDVSKDSVKSDVTPSSTTSSTPGGTSGGTQKLKEPASPSSSRKTSPFPNKKDMNQTGMNEVVKMTTED